MTMTSNLAPVGRRDLHEGWNLTLLAGPAPFEFREVPATVPGTLITDLHAAGLIEDPYLDRNEHDLAWTGECDVLYATTFTWAPQGADRVDLVAASLDTAATVLLNGRRLAEVQNQHRSWRFDVTDALLEGENRLEIRFASPLRTARDNEKILGTFPVTGNDLPYNALRKMACNLGWDWGPVLVTSGIAGPIGLEEWSAARLAEVRPRVTVEEGRGNVALHALVEHADLLDDSALTLSARLLDPAGQLVDETTLDSSDDELDLHLSAADPQLWWPRGYGDQPLYTVEITLHDADGTPRDAREHRIGFRTAAVIEEPDEIGTSFTIVVNDRPILAKGANWIPDDCFPVRLTAEDYRASITDAVDAGMNILRIWGGGLYESEHLYALCDELGIMVWQDFTLACAAYSELDPPVGRDRGRGARAHRAPGLAPRPGPLERKQRERRGLPPLGMAGAHPGGRRVGARLLHRAVPRPARRARPHPQLHPHQPLLPAPARRPPQPRPRHRPQLGGLGLRGGQRLHPVPRHHPALLRRVRLSGPCQLRDHRPGGQRTAPGRGLRDDAVPPESGAWPGQAPPRHGPSPPARGGLRRFPLRYPAQPGPCSDLRDRALSLPLAGVRGHYRVAAERLLARHLLGRRRRRPTPQTALVRAARASTPRCC